MGGNNMILSVLLLFLQFFAQVTVQCPIELDLKPEEPMTHGVKQQTKIEKDILELLKNGVPNWKRCCMEAPSAVKKWLR